MTFIANFCLGCLVFIAVYAFLCNSFKRLYMARVKKPSCEIKKTGVKERIFSYHCCFFLFYRSFAFFHSYCLHFLVTHYFRQANIRMDVSCFALCAMCAILIMTCDVVQSSSARFKIIVIGQDLGEIDQMQEIPAHNLQMQVGQTVTFVSQGIVMPRGKLSEPSEPDAGAWLFDDTVFELLPHDKNQFDKTQMPITLKALSNVAGQTRVRFVGKILGYDRKYDVFVHVTDG
jgi:hypothetical protein